MSGSEESQAFYAYSKGRYKEALPELSKLANQGDVYALLAVGWIKEFGAADAPDLEAALVCYQQAADLGSIDALHRLGRLLQKSNDVTRAKVAFELGAQKGYLPCICALGIILSDKGPDGSDFEAGVRWLKVAADRGHLFARRRLLQIEWKQKINIREKIKNRWYLFILTLRYFREYFSDRNSDKIV